MRTFLVTIPLVIARHVVVEGESETAVLKAIHRNGPLDANQIPTLDKVIGFYCAQAEDCTVVIKELGRGSSGVAKTAKLGEDDDEPTPGGLLQ